MSEENVKHASFDYNIDGDFILDYRSYDPEEGLWREVDDGKVLMPHEREKHTMIPVGNSKILILSG